MHICDEVFVCARDQVFDQSKTLALSTLQERNWKKNEENKSQISASHNVNSEHQAYFSSWGMF